MIDSRLPILLNTHTLEHSNIIILLNTPILSTTINLNDSGLSILYTHTINPRENKKLKMYLLFILVFVIIVCVIFAIIVNFRMGHKHVYFFPEDYDSSLLHIYRTDDIPKGRYVIVNDGEEHCISISGNKGEQSSFVRGNFKFTVEDNSVFVRRIAYSDITNTFIKEDEGEQNGSQIKANTIIRRITQSTIEEHEHEMAKVGLSAMGPVQRAASDKKISKLVSKYDMTAKISCGTMLVLYRYKRRSKFSFEPRVETILYRETPDYIIEGLLSAEPRVIRIEETIIGEQNTYNEPFMYQYFRDTED